jgi:hypothetical protein
MDTSTQNIADLNATEVAESMGLTREQADRQVEAWWPVAFEKAKREVSKMRERVTENAYKDSKLKPAYGTEIGRFSGREWRWLQSQYPGFENDWDFMCCYQKYTGQDQFLAAPDKAFFKT